MGDGEMLGGTGLRLGRLRDGGECEGEEGEAQYCEGREYPAGLGGN